jgi:hypothetical protein
MNYLLYFLNWSANESRPSLVAQPVTGEKRVEGVALDDGVGRTRRIKKIRQ